MPRNVRLDRILPWIVATLVVGCLLWRVPLGRTIEAASEARLLPFLALTALATLAWFWIDARVFVRLFGRFNTTLSPGEARSLRGLSYLLTPVHWNLGRAAVIARLRQTRHVPLLEGSSSMLLLQTLDGILLSGLAWLGLSRLPETAEVAALRTLTAIAFLALVVYLALATSSRPQTAGLRRLREVSLHHAHRLSRAQDLFALAAWRGLYYCVFVGLYQLGLASFGIELPLGVVLATVPIIQAIGALPITPAGLGTQQAAMLYFYSSYGEGAAILAFGLAFPLLVLVLRCLIGSLYLARPNGATAGKGLERSPQTNPSAASHSWIPNVVGLDAAADRAD